MKIFFRAITIAFLLTQMGLSQAKYLQSGPMAGYSEMREVLLWVQTNDAAAVKFAYFPDDNPKEKRFSRTVNTTHEQAYTAKIALESLEPGTHYTYELYINNKQVKRPYPLKFQTQALWQWRNDPPPFKFLIGSCNYINDTPYDRPGKPYGDGYGIFDTMAKQQADFMVWLGDNTYLREVDWYSRSGIMYRYTHTRSVAEMQPLLAAMHHYAIWDDHDYGPNNSDASFRQKADALDAFTYFWGNPTFGIDNQPGATTMFQWGDVEFYLLDNRYYRSSNNRLSGQHSILGDQQIDWLINALATSTAPFKFVVLGGQILSNLAVFENHANYSAEREKILDAIAQNNIWGVFFLSGDRHHSELSELRRRGQYSLYDLTVSPLTAGPNPRAANEANALRMADTFVGERNFAALEISGPRRERVLKISVKNASGEDLWTKEIAAKDLRN